MLQYIEQTDQSILGGELFPLHPGQGDVVNRKHAKLGVQHALVEVLVVMVKLLELGVALDQCVDVCGNENGLSGALTLHSRREPGKGWKGVAARA